MSAMSKNLGAGICLAILPLIFAACVAEIKEKPSTQETRVIADMESAPAFTVHGVNGKFPKVAITAEIASQGSKSAQIEYTGNGMDRAWVTIPLKADLGPYNVLAFDFYCAAENGAKCFTWLHRGGDGASVNPGDYGGSFLMENGRDGWTTIRLIKGRTLCRDDRKNAVNDWRDITAISFGMRGNMIGKAIVHIDRVRFEKREIAANILYNGSFEKTTNADVPDGWSRGAAHDTPPFGKEFWGIDDNEAAHGEKSLRIGVKDRYATSLYRSSMTRLKPGAPYVFSVFLKAGKDNVPARLSVSGLQPSSAEITVEKEWRRYAMTGKAESPSVDAIASVTLLADATTLWVDAAQLEEGEQASGFVTAENDDQRPATTSATNPPRHEENKSDTISADRQGKVEDEPFRLLGAEFDYYTSAPIAKARCVLGKITERTSLAWSVEKDGKTVIAPRTLMPRLGVNEWEIPIGGLPTGRYSITVELRENRKTMARRQASLVKLAPTSRGVRTNQWGRFFVYNTKPIFPYGFYCNILAKNKLSDFESMMTAAGAIGCNVHILYAGIDPATEDRLKLFLDVAEKYGQKAWVHLSPTTAWLEPKYAKAMKRFMNEEDAATARDRIIERYKDHPALFGWCTVDEPANKPDIYTKRLLDHYYSSVKRVDPYHPCAPSHVNKLGDSKTYADAMDCAILGYSSDSFLANALLREFMGTRLPIIVNRPCFGGMGEAKHEPTPAELRVAIYKAIILGARGACSYIYRCNSDILWKEFAKIGGEIKRLAPILLTADNCPLAINPQSSTLNGLLKTYGGKHYLLAVNSDKKEARAEFHLIGVTAFSTVKSLFDDETPKINAEKKTVSVLMGGMSVAVYELE